MNDNEKCLNEAIIYIFDDFNCKKLEKLKEEWLNTPELAEAICYGKEELYNILLNKKLIPVTEANAKAAITYLISVINSQKDRWIKEIRKIEEERKPKIIEVDPWEAEWLTKVNEAMEREEEFEKQWEEERKRLKEFEDVECEIKGYPKRKMKCLDDFDI